MPNDEIPQGNPDEQVQELGDGSVQEGSLETPVQPSSGDPLDELKDNPEGLLGEAKKWRSIAQRKSKVEPEKPGASKETASDTLTKTDLYRINSQKAIKQAKADPEFQEHWDDVTKLYVNRKGQDNPDAILEDLQDALLLAKHRAAPKTGDAGAELTTTPNVKRTSAAPVLSPEKKGGLLRKATDITEWYKS